MTTFTASEVRDWERAYKGTAAAKVFGDFADLLEAQEKAVPVMVVNHVSSAEHDLPIGMKLYTHPSPSDAEKRETMTPRELAKRIERGEKWKLADEPTPCQSRDAERLAEALRKIAREPVKPWPDPFAHSHEAFARAVHATWCDTNRTARDALAAHSAQTQPPAASVPDWTDAQCVAFMAVGLRHTEYKKGKSPTVEEIRQGAKAALAAQENSNG